MNTFELWHSKLRLGLVVVIGFLPIIVLTVVLGSLPVVAAPLPSSQAVTIVSATGPAGPVSLTQVFTVAINIDTDQVTRGSQFGLKFNPAVIQCEAASEGNFYKDWAQGHSASTLVFPMSSCNNISGTLSDMGITLLGGSGGPTGTGAIADVRFHALAAGTSPLTLTDVVVSDACVPSCHPLTITLSNGQVQIGPAPVPTATVAISLPTGSVSNGKTFTASISISTALVTRASSFGLQFDPARIQCQAASEGSFYKNWAQSNGASTLVAPTPACNNISGTLSVMGITLLGASGQGPTGTGVLANVRFQAVSAGTSPLTLTNVVVSNDCSPSCQSLPVALINNQIQVQAEHLVFLPLLMK